MKKICTDAFYGLNYIGFKEKILVLSMLNSKSLFRYDGVNMQYKTDKVEKRLSLMFSQDFLLVNNGTSALKLALISNNIGYGDEIIVPCLSFIATATACLNVGAIPVFAEIDNTFNIDVNDIEKKITKKTKAIVVVHFQGFPCDMEKIMMLCKKYNLILIEDVAQSFGTKYKNKYTGTFGDSSAFSFQSSKIITCGEGGGFTTKKNMDVAKRFADNGGEREFNQMPVWNKKYISYGENFKITDLESAILDGQLDKYQKIVKRQEYIYNVLTNKLTGYNIRKEIKDIQAVYLSLSLTFDNEEECDNFISYMNKNNIEFHKKISNYLPSYNTFINSLSPYKNNYPYNNYKVVNCNKSLNLLQRTAWLNLNSKLSKNDLKYIKQNLENYKNV